MKRKAQGRLSLGLDDRSPPTSRRKKARALAARTTAIEVAGPELLRRVLLGLATVLIVARPLVRGDDPGRLTPFAGAADQILTLLWLVTAVGWGIWRALRREGGETFHYVELGLLAIAGGSFLSASQAAYQHPAWLIAWEWLGLAVAFFLVRRLAANPDDNHRLLAAVLATGVTVAASALFQAAVEQPRLRACYEENPQRYRQVALPARLSLDPEMPRRTEALAIAFLVVPQGPSAPPWTALSASRSYYRPTPEPLPEMPLDLLEGRVSGTFGDPTALVGYLILLLPAVAFGAWHCWRLSRWSAQTSLMAGCTLAMIVAWFLSYSLGFFARLPQLLDNWPVAWEIIRAHPGLGMGPGNFGREYGRFLPLADLNVAMEPASFLFSLAANCGVPVLLLFLATLGVFFCTAWRLMRRDIIPLAPASEERGRGEGADQVATPPPHPQSLFPDAGARGEGGTRWEFYLGGVAGLILAFVLRAVQLPPSEILGEGLVAGGRSLIWFAVFALMESVDWSDRGRIGALLVGVAVLFFHLLFCAGLFNVGLMQTAAVIMALTVAGPESRPALGPYTHWLVYLLPLPITAAFAAAYWTMVAVPTFSSVHALAEARRQYTGWRETLGPRIRPRLESPTVTREEKLRALKRADDHISTIIRTLEDVALHDDPTDAYPHVELAYWYGELWQLDPSQMRFSTAAVRYAVEAQRLDPNGPEGYLAEYRLRRLFAHKARTTEIRGPQLALAVDALEKLIERRPQVAYYHYLLADTDFQLGAHRLGREQADIALKLDPDNPSGRQSLTDGQRQQLHAWLGVTAPP